ncbi:MAG: hypothetical protein LCH26_00375 [Proteobacteria bacterium]|nr:hypothetical protein [Pseudomonadota bacterium]
MIDISNYTSFFHDGSIIGIQHKGDIIKISMESAEIDKTDLYDEIQLSKDNTLKGLLIFKKIEQAGYDNDIKGLSMLADCGSIIRFTKAHRKVSLFIEWINYPPNENVSLFTTLTIIANEIVWQTEPELFDPFRR